MATKVKTTVTFTFSFVSDNEEKAIRKLLNWINGEEDGDVQLVKDSGTGEYTYLNMNGSIGSTFKFKTSAEFIEKFSKAEGIYIPARAMFDNTNAGSVTASTETIEVEEDK